MPRQPRLRRQWSVSWIPSISLEIVAAISSSYVRAGSASIGMDVLGRGPFVLDSLPNGRIVVSQVRTGAAESRKTNPDCECSTAIAKAIAFFS